MAEEKKKIMVVDDSLTMRTVIRRELGEEDYEIKEAKNGLVALELVRNSFVPDLITLDIDMPKLNGFDTCEKLYSEEYADCFFHLEGKRIPIIFVTSSDNLRDRKRGFELGASDFVTKPFEEGELLKLVSKMLHPDDRLKGITALLVDDSRSARMVVSKGLREEGIDIIEAEDGAKAFEIMCNKMTQIDIVVTDIEMPGMSGGELCQKIRRELGLIDVPIIFFTGIADRGKLLEVFQSGGTDYLVKPFIKEEMIARILAQVEKTQLNRRLRKIIHEMRENMRIKNDMIAVLSHDMRTPLNGIIGFSNLLMDEKYIQPEHRENIVQIKESGRMLLNLINDILALSKIKSEKEKQKLEMKPVSLLKVVEKSVRALNNLAELKEQKLYLKNRTSNAVILGNHDGLMRVINNLLANSIKFTPEKGTIAILLEPGSSEDITISVTDTGIGISKERLPYLFDKYSRISQKGTAGEAGTGLGMAIVKEIIEIHDGTVQVSSEVGKGTQFKITIPLPDEIKPHDFEENEDRAETRNEEILKRIKGLNVLLAEDNPVNQQIAKIILMKSGCTVKKAIDGLEAVERFTGAPDDFQVIFMDMEMPEMNGLEATDVIRKKGFTDIPIIAMTASTRDEDKRKCAEAGMNGFITKPISQGAILEVLGELF
ncbi:MAG: response regulator [bacterium]|nr:response regulator [bacterium]